MIWCQKTSGALRVYDLRFFCCFVVVFFIQLTNTAAISFQSGKMRCFSVFIIFAIIFNNQLFAKPLSSARTKRNAVKDKSRLWAQGIVPYTIDNTTFSHKESEIIEEAMEEISSVSCIVFKRRTSENVYVEFLKGKGCNSPIGFTGRPRKLTLKKECIAKKRIIHMLFHTLGFFHEHARPDRDHYVIVNHKNIHPSLLSSFTKKTYSQVDTLDLPYDYNSILHFHEQAGSFNPSLKTLEHIQGGNRVFGQAGKMSELDILKLKKLYGCPIIDGDDGGSGFLEHEGLIAL